MKAIFKRLMTIAGAAATFAGVSTAALAAESGIKDWQFGYQASVTDVMDDITWFNGFTLVIITVITLFVLALLVICMVKFSAKANPVPSRTSHNTLIEVVWTVVPILILVVIAIPSFRLLYKQLDIPQYDMTLKVIGNSWYWDIEYPNEGMENISISANMLQEADKLPEDKQNQSRQALKPNEPRLLAVDYDVIIPVDTTVLVQVTSNDVIHAFAMPAFGVKIDAIPGRLNETWFNAREEGIYYGQCSELCGKFHAFMPLAIRVVSKEQFAAWAAAAQDDVDAANEQLAASLAAAKTAATTADTEEMSVAAK
ncbi:cytochrome c oxidase subunit II [Roseibium sp. M-1]